MKGWSWKIGWQGRAEGPGRPSRGGRVCWTGGWGRGCGHTLSMLSPPPHSETLCDSSVLCDAGLGLHSHSQCSVCSGSLAVQKWDSENGMFSHFWTALSTHVWAVTQHPWIFTETSSSCASWCCFFCCCGTWWACHFHLPSVKPKTSER